MAPPIKCSCGECKRCKHRGYMRAYYRRHLDTMRENARRSQAKTRTPLKRHLSYLKYKDKTDPEKKRARNALTHAIHSGRVVRGECEHANRTECRGRIEGHHPDYSRPLDVLWLCQRHHSELHRRF